jgi:PKD repeat protein
MFQPRVVLLAVCALLVLSSATAGGAPTPTHVHFTAAGDYGASANTAGVLSALASGGSDAHLALGDLSYGVTGEEAAWCDFVKNQVGDKFPFQVLSGNHESDGQHGNINDFSACLPNQLPGVVGTYGRQYFVDLPQDRPLVRFVMISPGLTFPGGPQWNYSAGSARYQWTAATIDGARSANIPWVVVGMHKPCLSLGEYSCDPGPDLTNMLISKRVDLVLNGHEHLYQRSKQLALGSQCSALSIGTYNANCVVDADSDLTKGAGTVFTTIGTGGVPLRDVSVEDPEAGYFAATSGANQSPSYGFGDFDVTPDRLLMRFVRGSQGTFSDEFTLTRDAAPPVNAQPTAAFTATPDALTTSFDASQSSDPEGPISSWTWDFGDGSQGSGSKVSHTYPRAGTFPVVLTVTDGQGATNTVSKEVTVSTAPVSNILARDEFDRTLTGSWGQADVGGDWTLRGASTRFSVAGSAGRLQIPVSTALYSDLNGVSSQSARLTAEFSLDKIAAGAYISLIGRQVGSDFYVARLVPQTNGQVRLYLLRGSGTGIGAATFVPDFPMVAGEHYRASIEVRGTSPTTVSAKVWRASSPEPTAWQRTATDSAAGLQTRGRVGVFGYLPSAASGSSPVTLSFHQLVVTGTN